MLKQKKITVWVDDIFQVEELYPEESAELSDEVDNEFSGKGDLARVAIKNRLYFVKRLIDWKIDQDCNESNKQEFFRQFTKKSNEILSSAEKLIAAEREERLGNLLSGASGT